MEVVVAEWSASDGWSTALRELDSESTLVIVFGDRRPAELPHPALALAEHVPKAIIIGCSTAGRVVGSTLDDGALTATVVRFDRSRLFRVSAQVSSAADSFEAGRVLGGGLPGPGLRCVFILSDGLHVNGSELVAGVLSAVAPGVLVTGGLAADGDRFEQTWVLDEGRVLDGRVTAVGFYGENLRIGSGSRGGWGIFGPERVVTRAEGNVLYELDGRPALELYTRYLGDLSAGLPASALLFPLAVRPDGRGEQRVRTVLAVDEGEQSMTFAGDIPLGWRAQLMRSSADRLIDGAAEAAVRSLLGHDAAGPELAIAISCVGRRLVLGERAEEEFEAILETLPSGAQVVGFYSYGEIAPDTAGVCDLHNQTMTITTVSEDLRRG